MRTYRNSSACGNVNLSARGTEIIAKFQISTKKKKRKLKNTRV